MASPLHMEFDPQTAARLTPHDMAEASRFGAFLLAAEAAAAGLACWTDDALRWLGVDLDKVTRADGVVTNLRQPEGGLA